MLLPQTQPFGISKMFNKEVSIGNHREKHCWSYFAIRMIRLLGLVKWQMYDILGLA